MGLVHSYPLMLVIRCISGIASAFIFVLASSIVLDRLAAAEKINWAGYFYSGVGFGIFFSTLFIPDLHSLFSWEGVWIGLAAISLVLGLFVWLWLKEPSQLERKKDLEPPAVPTPPRKWMPWLIAAYGVEGLGYIVTGTFIVAMAEDANVFSSNAAIVWATVGLAAIPSCIIWGGGSEEVGICQIIDARHGASGDRNCCASIFTQSNKLHHQCSIIWSNIYGDYYACNNLSARDQSAELRPDN